MVGTDEYRFARATVFRGGRCDDGRHSRPLVGIQSLNVCGFVAVVAYLYIHIYIVHRFG